MVGAILRSSGGPDVDSHHNKNITIIGIAPRTTEAARGTCPRIVTSEWSFMRQTLRKTLPACQLQVHGETNVEKSKLPSLVKEGGREAAGGSFKRINLLISTTPALIRRPASSTTETSERAVEQAADSSLPRPSAPESGRY